MPKTFRVTRKVRLTNQIAIALLRVGLKSGFAHLLSVQDRKSGRIRSTPVSPHECGERRYLVAGSHEAEWVKNARAAGWAVLSRGRRSERVGLVEIDPARTAPILQAFAEMVGGGHSFFEAGTDSPLEAFEAEAPYHPVFEIVALPEESRDSRSVGSAREIAAWERRE